MRWDWKFHARPEQLAPSGGDWMTWVINAGRGFGKTKAGSERTREMVEAGYKRIALIAETHKDLEEVMVFGDSGIMSAFPPHQKPIVTKKPIQITFHTGAIALGYNATEPGQLRGPQFDFAWCDELAKWSKARETWDMLQFALRLGNRPQVMITTTPRPIPLLKEIMTDETTVVTRGSTFDNASNLAPSFIKAVRKKYEGTRLGRQELEAEMLEDLPGALWVRENIDINRVEMSMVNMRRIVVAIDPSGTRGEEDSGDSIGIVVAGEGVDDRGYILEDLTCKVSPKEWGQVAVDAFHRWSADRIVAERNFGGAMVEHVIRTVDPNVAYKEVTASRGKVVRAEPIAALYEQNRVSHVGRFDLLEDQMCLMASDGYAGEGSPDRADALVWALTELMMGTAYNMWDM